MNFGVAGKGKAFADKFITKLENGEATFNDWVDLFPTPEDALINFQVTDCSQVVDGKLKLKGIEDIAKMFKEAYTAPF